MLDIKGKFQFDDPAEIAKLVAERMKARRLELNLTQFGLAAKAGVSFGSLKRFENQHEISFGNLILLAFALNATEDFEALFGTVQYQTMDELLNHKNRKQRKRGRRNS